MIEPGLTVEDLLSRLQQPRIDVRGLPQGALAKWLCSAPAEERWVVLTADADSADRMASNLRFFLGENTGEGDAQAVEQVLLFPALDVSPFLAVAPDRRASMDRLATLFHLGSELSWRFVVAPVPAALRRVMPRESVARGSQLIEFGEELDRERLITVLAEGGYVRVPVAEDPGTFAVRGGVLDVFPPHASYPSRVELDDDTVASIKVFDPDDQRTIREVERVFVHPARDTLLSADPKETISRVRDLCDDANYPSSKTRALLDDLESGRSFYGLDGLLPAFHSHLETLFDYCPGARVALVDPPSITQIADLELSRAIEDREARVEDGSPAFPVDRLYADEGELARILSERQLVVSHKLASVGRPMHDESLLAQFELVEDGDFAEAGADDQGVLVAELTAKRGAVDDDTLRPVALRAAGWLERGFRVLMNARTRTQAERLISLLQGYEVPVARAPEAYSQALDSGVKGEVQVVIGELQDGFVWGAEGVVVVTEGEIFGTRVRKKSTTRKRKRKAAKAFLEDLKELQVGDYVVHTDHGVGRYLGIERKNLGQSALERLQGVEVVGVEVLVLEYVGGDRLFVPVTRLAQIQKFASKDAKPKLDRLGGSTFAKKKAKAKKAVRKLADDLLVLYAERAAATRPALEPAGRSFAQFEATFPFDETPDQARAIEDVLQDLENPRPMDRLVCGDVGFGKTEVALRGAFRMAMSGRQVALLCPTTVLAQQHFRTFAARLQDYPLKIGQLSRFVGKEESAKVLSGIKDGTVDICVGTHRLLSKDVHFGDLGLLVIDEEQRFGVAHKERIKKLKKSVDVLTLSATPIPRTLQLAIGGMRDLSLITTAPTDRRAVRTFACRWDDHTIREAILRETSRGGQVFFVYNRIEGLYERAQRLQTIMPDLRIAVAHGQMKEGELERTMTDFIDGEYDVLCSTAIIESGIDIPRANTMLIDRADMFGLSQLYQLRGRVGRSRERAYCYLITPPPSTLSDEARHRIEALERFTELGSGFQVASLDMELRGVGDLLGAEQSGSVSQIGFDLFCQMLEDAVAQLRGEEVTQDIDPELTLSTEHYLPDTYIEDVGLRLSFYKRLSTAEDEDSIGDIGGEMEDRFGPPPPVAVDFVRAMQLRPMLRQYCALGCEASDSRVTLHLREDTPLDPSKIIALVGEPQSPWKLTPDMRLTRRFDANEGGDAIDRVRALFRLLRPLQRGV
ncbi:MAG: transcription-repair coupling factor [Polyangiales bacterium]